MKKNVVLILNNNEKNMIVAIIYIFKC